MTIDSFAFPQGKIIAGKYRIEASLGSGWESEVYLITEITTGIERAAKFFFPQRNLKNKVAKDYAQKLHRMRAHPNVIQYFTQEEIIFKGQRISCLISEYVEGDLLSDFIKKLPGKRMHYFEALHVTYELAAILEKVHNMNEYHGDLHAENILIVRRGIRFDIKLIDPFNWKDSKKLNIEKDAFDIVRILYEIVGGAKLYAKLPSQVKSICCGLKPSLMRKKFKNASQLRGYIDSLEWDGV